METQEPRQLVKIPDVKIERAQLTDLKEIINLYKQADKELDEKINFDKIPEFLVDDFFSDIKTHRNFHLFVLKYKNKIVATCLLVIIPSLFQGLKCNGIIEGFVSDKNYRNKGYGKKLINHALGVAEDSGCSKVSFLTNNDNEYMDIYKRSGFKDDVKKSFVKML